MAPKTDPLQEVLSQKSFEAVRRTSPPGAIEMMQPISAPRADPGTGWLFEPLFDGTRCLAVRDERGITLFENGTDRADASDPELEHALMAVGPDRFAVDGLILRVDPESGRDLARPSRSAEDPDGARCFLVLDLLWAFGSDLCAVPLIERRNALRALFRYSPPIVCGSASSEPAEVVFRRAERAGWLGVVAKRSESPWVSGPSLDWRLWRCPSR